MFRSVYANTMATFFTMFIFLCDNNSGLCQNRKRSTK